MSRSAARSLSARIARRLEQAARLLVEKIDNDLFVLDGLPRDVPERWAGLQVRRIVDSDRPRLREMILRENSDAASALKRLDDAWARGYLGYLAQNHEDILAYGWICTAEMPHPQVSVFDLDLGSGDVLAFDLFVGRSYRGQNLPVAVLVKMHAALRTEGYRHIYGLVDINNRRSALVHLRAGYRKLGRRHAWAIGSLLLASSSGIHRYDKRWI